LYIGLFVWNCKIGFGKVLKVILLAEFVLIIPLIIKCIWFFFFKLNYTIEDFQMYYPLSLSNLFNLESISKLLLYPLQLLNFFELLYCIVLGHFISKLINNNFDKAFKIVLSSYVPALIVWVVFVMFLTVTLNPA
jgi:hypothetical protein